MMPAGTPLRPGMPMPQDPEIDVTEIPPELASFLNTLDEFAHAPQPLPPPEHPLYVPLFFRQMNGFRGTPVFQSAPLNPGAKRKASLAVPTPRKLRFVSSRG